MAAVLCRETAVHPHCRYQLEIQASVQCLALPCLLSILYRILSREAGLTIRSRVTCTGIGLPDCFSQRLVLPSLLRSAVQISSPRQVNSLITHRPSLPLRRQRSRGRWLFSAASPTSAARRPSRCRCLRFIAFSEAALHGFDES